MNLKKTILFVSHKHPPSIGGMETHNYYLRLGMEKDFNLIPLIIAPGESRISFFVNIRGRIKKAIRENQIDSLYVNDGLLAIIVSTLKREYPQIEFIATVHGLEATYPSSIYQKNLLSRLRYFDKLVCVSNFTKNVLDQSVLFKGKTYCVLNGISHEEHKVPKDVRKSLDEKYQYLKGRKILLSVGRPVKRKGFSWFASKVLPKLEGRPVYIVAGPLPKDKKFYEWRTRLLPKNVNQLINLAFGYPEDAWELRKIENNNLLLTDGVSFDELNYLIDRADLFIVPNLEVKGDAEGFGLVALEGAIRSKVVLAADLQGLKDAISDQNNGFKLPSANEGEWVIKCNDLLKNPDDIQLLGEKAKLFTTANFSWDKMSDSYIKLFQK